MNIVSLIKSDVVILDEKGNDTTTIFRATNSEGKVEIPTPKISSTHTVVDTIAGVPILKVDEKVLYPLPDEKEDVVYLVSPTVASFYKRHTERNDIYVLYGVVRDRKHVHTRVNTIRCKGIKKYE